jgi:hypothetical protein
VLACIDQTTICSPDESVCGSLKYWGGLKQSDTEEYRVLSMLYFSLLLSPIGNTVTFRKATGLDATRNLVGSVSLPLAKEQWKVEVQQLFETSLARIQINARNIARGHPNADPEAVINITRPTYEGICQMYKFNSTGWRNVNVSAFMAAICSGLVLIVIGIPAKNEKLWIEGTLRRLSRTTLFTIMARLWTNLLSCFKTVFGWIAITLIISLNHLFLTDIPQLTNKVKDSFMRVGEHARIVYKFLQTRSSQGTPNQPFGEDNELQEAI